MAGDYPFGSIYQIPAELCATDVEENRKNMRYFFCWRLAVQRYLVTSRSTIGIRQMLLGIKAKSCILASVQAGRTCEGLA